MSSSHSRLWRRIRWAILNAVTGIVPSKLARIRANQKTNRAIMREYGDLEPDMDWRSISFKGLENESREISGPVVKTINDIAEPINSILLAGEAAAARPLYAKLTDTPTDLITTAGLHPDADYVWDFEQSPPEIGRFQCTVSYAILEHLIDPYRHVRALVGLMEPGGNLVIFTVSSGFPYRRHPIDCLRFFPDWFETVANRLGLIIADRYYGSERIMCRLQRP